MNAPPCGGPASKPLTLTCPKGTPSLWNPTGNATHSPGNKKEHPLLAVLIGKEASSFKGGWAR